MKNDKRQDQICRRLKELREDILGVSLSAFAREIGISKERLASYEQCRAPLRADLALRMCRRWIISEEYLATGKLTAYEEAARKRGIFPLIPELANIAKRQCVDLWSEREWKVAPPGALFSEVYDQHLAGKYRVIVAKYFFAPRLVFTDDVPEPDLIQDVAAVWLKTWLQIIKWESRTSHDAAEWRNQRQFVSGLLERGDELLQEYVKRPRTGAPAGTAVNPAA